MAPPVPKVTFANVTLDDVAIDWGRVNVIAPECAEVSPFTSTWFAVPVAVVTPDDEVRQVEQEMVRVPDDTAVEIGLEPAIVLVAPSAVAEDPESLAKVIDELVSDELPILVMVFDEPEILLLVRVSVVSFPTKLVVASGSVQVLAAVRSAEVSVPVKALVVVAD